MNSPDAETAQAYLRDALDRLAGGAGEAYAAWTVVAVRRIVRAWGRLTPGEKAETMSHAERAGEAAAQEATRRLRAVSVADASRPGAPGPLELLRDLYTYPTIVLVAAGIPAVERDSFESRHFPDDRYGLRIQSFRDLPGGDELAELHAVWGLAKAATLREERGSLFESALDQPPEPDQ